MDMKPHKGIVIVATFSLMIILWFFVNGKVDFISLFTCFQLYAIYLLLADKFQN